MSVTQQRRAGSLLRFVGAWALTLAVLAALLVVVPASRRAPAAVAGTIVTSQLGFAPGDPMSAVLGVPTGSVVERTLRVVDADGVAVWAGDGSAVEYRPGGWIGSDQIGDTYRLDFTAARLPPGRYRIESNGVRSPLFPVGIGSYDVTHLDPLEFFRIQLAGEPHSWVSLDGTSGGHGPSHRDDARQATRRDKGGGDTALIQQDALTLPGGRRDVAGGWYDAGDYNEYMGNTPWAAYLLLRTAEDRSAYWQTVDDGDGVPDLLEVARPALEWMLKMQHTDGSVYERVFNGYAAAFDGRPDRETDGVVGTADDRPLDTDRYADITAKAVYAWAVGYRVFGDPRYLTAARRAWDWASVNQTRVKPKVYGGGLYFGDIDMGLTLGAVELHRAQAASGSAVDGRYLAHATARVRAHLDLGDWTSPSSWDSQGSYVLRTFYPYAETADQGRIVAQLAAAADRAIAAQATNAYRFTDWWVYGDFGQNETSASASGDALWLHEITGERRYYDYAVNQLAWIFGRNPFGESWLAHEGAVEFTRSPHWRATAKHPIRGVVVPGATDRNGDRVPDYTDTGEWFYAEPSINQQAMFIRVMTDLYFRAGGTVNPPQNLPPAIRISAPQSGASVTGSTVVSATVTDSTGVASVVLSIDGGPATPLTPTSDPSVWQIIVDTRSYADGNHQLKVVAADPEGLTAQQSVTVAFVNSGAQTLRVHRIEGAIVRKSTRSQGRCDIFVVDAFGRPISGAAVSGAWSGSATDTFTGTTDSSGKATDYSNSATVPVGATFTCSVRGIAKSGWTYTPSANGMTSLTLTVT